MNERLQYDVEAAGDMLRGKLDTAGGTLPTTDVCQLLSETSGVTGSLALWGQIDRRVVTFGEQKLTLSLGQAPELPFDQA
ncbi:MAG TPA: hypothetical protein VK674_00405 [Candidatus Limnocylindria bacterium]|nr:hypothetical protein [Candidatus Limnocylindria bacterium]